MKRIDFGNTEITCEALLRYQILQSISSHSDRRPMRRIMPCISGFIRDSPLPNHDQQTLGAVARHFGQASAPRDQLSHRIRRCAEQSAAGRHHEPAALARYPRRERLRLGRLGFQQSVAEQSELLSAATALVVKPRRGFHCSTFCRRRTIGSRVGVCLWVQTTTSLSELLRQLPPDPDSCTAAKSMAVS